MSDFYQAGKTYVRHTDPAFDYPEWRFRVDCITEHPDDGMRTALGWRFFDGAWEPYAYDESDWEIHETSRRVLGE